MDPEPVNFRITALTLASVALAWDPAGTTPLSYWSVLAGHPDKILAKRYLSQAEINGDSQRSPNTCVTVDSVEQAARVRFVNDRLGDASLPNQVRPKLPQAYSNGTLLFVWDAKWHADYGNATYRAGLNTHKAFQLANHTVSGDQRRLEPRMKYSLASFPDIARVDTRVYPDGQGPGDAVPGQLAQFTVKPNTWTRRWSFVEFQTPTVVLYSEWIADEMRPEVQLHNRRQVNLVNGGGISQFWFEYNSSQKRASSAGPLTSWFRDLAVLRNLSFTEAANLVAQGAPVQ